MQTVVTMFVLIFTSFLAKNGVDVFYIPAGLCFLMLGFNFRGFVQSFKKVKKTRKTTKRSRKPKLAKIGYHVDFNHINSRAAYPAYKKG